MENKPAILEDFEVFLVQTKTIPDNKISSMFTGYEDSLNTVIIVNLQVIILIQNYLVPLVMLHIELRFKKLAYKEGVLEHHP